MHVPTSRLQQRYERIVGALAPDVYRYAYALCRDRAQAEDITQETFLRAWRFLAKLRDDRKAKSWLFTTVRREFARHYERVQPVLEDVDPEHIAGVDDVDPDVWTLRRAIMALPRKYREVIVLQVIGGYSGQDIAELLDVPRATVNTRLFRARAELRKRLNGDARDTPDASLGMS